jgi:hypothetical protein
MFLTLFFYRLHNSVIDETTNTYRVGYVDSKYKIVLKKKYFLIFLIYFCLHIYQNTRIYISLISSNLMLEGLDLFNQSGYMR